MKKLWCLFTSIQGVDNILVAGWKSRPSIRKLYEFFKNDLLVIEPYQIKALHNGHPITFKEAVYTLSPIEEGKWIQAEQEVDL